MPAFAAEDWLAGAELVAAAELADELAVAELADELAVVVLVEELPQAATVSAVAAASGAIPIHVRRAR